MTLKKRMLSFLLVGTLAVSFAVPANATDYDKRKKQLEKQIKETEAEEASLKEKLESIVEDIEEAKQDMAETEQEIAQAEEDLFAAKKEEKKQYNGMKKRIKYMYENGNTEFIEVLFAAKDFSDLLNKAEYVTKLSEYDRDMLKEFQKLVKEVEEKEKALEEEYKKLGVLQEELSVKQGEVETLLKEKSAELEDIKSEMGEVNDLIEKAKQQAAQKPSRPGNGGSSGGPGDSVIVGNGFFTHPCPGMSYMSSYFGEVRQGIGDSRPHAGHDYAAPRGTPIYAAAAGTVKIAGRSSSAGNWVVIDHGNGLTTKYMHMFELPYVSAGQRVEKGQHIGGVGTTGMSFGNHLHFQVEEYGVPVNPSNYM